MIEIADSEPVMRILHGKGRHWVRLQLDIAENLDLMYTNLTVVGFTCGCFNKQIYIIELVLRVSRIQIFVSAVNMLKSCLQVELE